MRYLLIVLLGLTAVEPCLADSAVSVVQGSAGGSEFVFVVTDKKALGIPTTVLIPATGQQPSFVLQKRPAPGRSLSYTLSATFSYKLDTDTTKFKNAAQAVNVDTSTLTALSTLHYITYVEVWNSKSSKFDQRKIDEGSTNPTGSMVTSFSIDFADADGLKTFLQNPHSLYLLMDLQIEVQIALPRDTKPIDQIIASAFDSMQMSTVMPSLTLLKSLQAQYGQLVGGNPNYAADAVSRGVSGLSLSLDEQGRPMYRKTAMGPPSLGPFIQTRVFDRIAASTAIDLCSDPSRLSLIDVGKTGCDNLSAFLQSPK